MVQKWLRQPALKRGSMTSSFKVACVQNCATPDVQYNISTSLRIAEAAAADGAQLIATPEYFSGLETRDGLFLPGAYREQEHPVPPAFSQAAKRLGVWFLLGSIGVVNDDGRISNRSCLISPDGRLMAKYDKIHMFDVNLDGAIYREVIDYFAG